MLSFLVLWWGNAERPHFIAFNKLRLDVIELVSAHLEVFVEGNEGTEPCDEESEDEYGTSYDGKNLPIHNFADVRSVLQQPFVAEVIACI